MQASSPSPLSGDFTVFGFTRDPRFVKECLTARFGIEPLTIHIGSKGQFFLHTSYGDVAQSEEAVVLKLGFLRSNTKSALGARQLLEQKLVGPQSIHTDAISGNALVIGMSKSDPVFSVFQTLMAVPQFYYSVSRDGILCSDVLKCLVKSISHPELDETILPHHFLFHSVYGSLTYYKEIGRLRPGHLLRWTDGAFETRLVRSLERPSDEADYVLSETRALNGLCESLQTVIGAYVSQIEESGQRPVNLLSGGVDSTLLQYFLNITSLHHPARSISYAIRVPSFEFEIEYARQASRLLHTEHTFVDLTPQDYPALLTRAVDILAQPPSLEAELSMLALAEFVYAENRPERYFFTAHAADSIFGETMAGKLKGLRYVGKAPFAVLLLRACGAALSPITHRSRTLLTGAAILASTNDPHACISPSNTIRVYATDRTWHIARRCFGDRAIREALAYRRELASQYSQTSHYLETIHFIDMLTDTYEIAAQEQQLFLARSAQQVHPLYDEEVLRAALAIHPDRRYLKGFRPKYLLRELLVRKTNAPVAYMRKGGSTVPDDFMRWMKLGPLRPLVEDIQRPAFMNRDDFEGLLREPDPFLWPLLTYDLLHKQAIGNRGHQ